MKRVEVALGKRSYDIVIGSGLLRSCGTELSRLRIGTDAVVITNKRLLDLYGRTLAGSLRRSGFTVRFMTVPDSERAKSLGIAAGLINRLGAYDVGKKLFVIAFGGGVIGDLAGFVAAVYKRGIPYVQIPTTLLAQVDSAIGGKVAVDLPIGKNLAGAFYQPRIVISDVSLIRSLPLRQLKSGLSEIIKYGVISDPELFRFLETNHGKLLRCDGRSLEQVIYRSARIKAAVVSKDELDNRGIRAVLNYGHTIGHAIEAASSYSGRYNHGEAVAIGMIAAAGIASALGLLRDDDLRRIGSLLRKVGLPSTARGIRLPDVYSAHLHDKKFIGTANRFILPRRIGSAALTGNIPDAAIRHALKECIVTG